MFMRAYVLPIILFISFSGVAFTEPKKKQKSWFLYSKDITKYKKEVPQDAKNNRGCL